MNEWATKFDEWNTNPENVQMSQDVIIWVSGTKCVITAFLLAVKLVNYFLPDRVE